MSSSFVSIIPIKILFSITISTIPFPTSKHQINNLEIKIVHSSPTLLNENRIIIQIQRQYLAQTASPSASSVRIRAKTLNGQTAIGKCLLATIARCACGIPAYTLHTFPWPRRTSVCHFFPIHYQHTRNAKHDQCSALIYWTETDNRQRQSENQILLCIIKTAESRYEWKNSHSFQQIYKRSWSSSTRLEFGMLPI